MLVERQIVSILQSAIFFTIFVSIMRYGFTSTTKENLKTSVDALAEVLGMPVSTIHNELHKLNIYPDNDSSDCIDEKALERFAVLFNKRMKRYFVSSVENFEQLTEEERRDFVEFSESFSKDGKFTLNWRRIDKEALRETFFRKLKELNRPCKICINVSDTLLDIILSYITVSRCDNPLPVFDDVMSISLSIDNIKQNTPFPYVRKRYVIERYLYKDNQSQRRLDSLKKVIKSRHYLHRIRKTPLHHRVVVSITRKCYVSIRLHSVPDDGTSDDSYNMSVA